MRRWLPGYAPTGIRVRAAYRDPQRVARAAEVGEDAVEVDYTRRETLPSFLHDVDTVFLIAAMSPGQTGHELAVISAAEAAGVQRIVKLSLWRADERLTPIAELHRPAEEALHRSALRWTLLRPNFYMQNFAHLMAPGIVADGIIAQPGGTAPISYIDTRDVARVAAHVLTTTGHDSKVYSLSGPEALTYDEVAERFSTALGKPVRYVALTAEQARRGLLDAGLPPFVAESLVKVAIAYGDGGADTVLPTVTELTGMAPTGLTQFIDDHRQTFDARH